jgi:NADPH:quinone reductase
VSPARANHEYLRGLGASEVFDYHDADWIEQVLAVVPGGVDVLLDGAGGRTRDQAVGAIREGGRAVFLVGPGAQLPPGIVAVSFSVDVTRQRLEAIGRLVDGGKLRPQIEAILPLEQVREALERVASRHTRGKIVLRIEQ